MTAHREDNGQGSVSGATALAALIPWAVVSCIWAFIFFASLWGTSVEGEEGFSVALGAALVVVAIGVCVLAGLAVAHRTRLSRGGGIALAVFLTSLWTAAFLAWTISGGVRAVPSLPPPVALIVASGFTVPVGALGILGLIFEAVVRRRRNNRCAADSVQALSSSVAPRRL